MKDLIGIFIKKGLPLYTISETEEVIDQWMNNTGEYKDIVLPHLINQKLLKNEQEY